MDITQFKQELITKNIIFTENESLAKFTTWKIGGPADVFIRLKEPKLLVDILKSAKQFDVPITFLGSGSNVLIHDNGIRGLVIRNEYSGITIDDKPIELSTESLNEQEISIPEPEARLIQADPEAYYDFMKLDYDESNKPRIKVLINSGTYLSYAINYLISQGITGLQWFAGIPGTIGGAIFNNIHGGSHFFSEYLDAVELIDNNGKTQLLQKNQLGVDYDKTDLQDSFSFIKTGFFSLPLGDKEKAQHTAIAWATAKKKRQPYNSGGCSFKNITTEELRKLDIPSNGWGYIIDQILQLKGFQIGGAKISNLHAAFIENTGNASSEDVLSIMNHIYHEANQKLHGVTPKTEIFFLGFNQAEIEKFL